MPRPSTKQALATIVERVSTKPTQYFAVWATLLVSLLTTWLALPSVDRAGYKLFGQSFLTLLGTQSGVGYNKELASTVFAVLCLVGLVVGYLLLIGRPGRWGRAAIVLLCCLSGANAFAVFRNPVIRDQQFEQLRMSSLPHPADRSIFSKTPFLEAKVDNAEAFHRVANEKFEAHHDALTAVWHIESEQRLRSLFFMNLVMSLWSYGNPDLADRRRPSCALNNVNTSLEGTPNWDKIVSGSAFRFTSVPRDPDRPQAGVDYDIDLPSDVFASYLADDIGCCVDYVVFLSMLLSHDGIPNNLVVINGHWLLEARIDGVWNTLDPTTGLIFEDTWTGIQRRDLSSAANLSVMVVPTPSAIEDGDGGYRPLVGMLRLRVLMQALDPSAPALMVFPMRLSQSHRISPIAGSESSSAGPTSL